jgi:hypothetical protein
MQNLLTYVNGLGAFNSKSAFQFPVYAAKTPTVFLDGYNLDKSWFSSDGKEIVRFNQNDKIGKIEQFKWVGSTLMVQVVFDKPITKAGFVYTVAAWIRPAELNVEIPVAKPASTGTKRYYSTGSGVNFRATPSTSGKSLGQFSKGAEIGESDGKTTNVVGGIGWLKFTHPVWGVGYVRQDFTSTTQPSVGGTILVKPTETGTPSEKLPIQSSLNTASSSDSNDKTQKVIFAGIGIVLVGFIGFLIYNGKQTKKAINKLTNGIKLK